MQSLKARRERENQEREPEPTDSLSSLDSRRSGQETGNERASAKSSRTFDSGLGEEYAHIITEHSDQERKQSVEKEERPPTPDLPIVGRSIAARHNAKLQPVFPAHNSNPQNINLCIVERPASRSGQAFDITFTNEGTPNRKKLPLPIARLQAQKRKHEFSREELDEKLKKADQRRQESERQMLERLAQQIDKQCHTQQALQSFADKENKRLEEQLQKSIDKNHSNREAYLKSLRDKLRAKENHAKVVRENRQSAGATIATD
jgi:hypothetical protein